MSFNFLIKLRKKTDSEKKRILVVSTIIAMMVIFGIWFLLSSFFGVENENSSQTTSIFLTLIKNLIIEIKNVFVNFKF
ncbi:hypothetical protein L6261_00335 [Candidatus Parcubacteria bacterium]|nr:hypothetical protein [Candidatus Parcubacteria bacterium]